MLAVMDASWADDHVTIGERGRERMKVVPVGVRNDYVVDVCG